MLHPVQGSCGFAGHGEPWQPGDLRDPAECEKEAISDGPDDERFGRPAIAGTVEFHRRKGHQAVKAWTCQRNIAIGRGGRSNRVVVRKRVHDSPPGASTTKPS